MYCIQGHRLLCFVVMAFLVHVGLTASDLYAADYYVSVNGQDSAAGTEAAPWRTIQKAANSLKPGDTAYVQAGNYPEHVTINVSGTETQRVTLRSRDGDRVTLNPGSFAAFSKRHVRIEGFHILNTTGDQAAIEFNGNGGHVEIAGNEISGVSSTAAAIRVGGQMHDFTIDGNHVHHNDTGNQEAIRVHERTRDFRVTNNEVNNNTNIGIDIVGWARFGKPTNGLVSRNFAHDNSTAAPWAAEIYLDGPNNITVEYNIASGSEYGFQLGCEPSNDSSSGNILRYNIAYDNTEYGLGIGGYTGGNVHHCQIYNNVLANNKRAIGFSKNAGHDNVVVNNILYEPKGQSINYLSQPRDTIIDFNCYFGRYGATPGRNSIIGDPLFTDVAGKKFSLRVNSPCVDAGVPFKTQHLDFAGLAVPVYGDSDVAAKPDIGAFELQKAPGQQ